MRILIRKVVPAPWRLQWRLMQNRWRDTHHTKGKAWANPSKEKVPQKDNRIVNQSIKKTSRSDNKVHNMRLAIESLNGMYLQVGQAFSFWQAVGPATAKRGYKSGRNLINGVLTEDYGGGLCQLAGIIYHTALLAGLEVLERHSHSVDIYTEQERYTPLGADATVVYGYKDLKLHNPYHFPVQVFFDLKSQQLSCIIISPQVLVDSQIFFVRKQTEKGWQVNTQKVVAGKSIEVLVVSEYRKPLGFNTN